MTAPELVITKNKWGRSIHLYRVNGDLFPSVTGILGVLKPWPLVNAAAKEVAWAMVKDRHQVFALGEVDEGAAVEVYKGAHWKAWNAKRDHGINVHAMVAADAPPSERERAYVSQYQLWLADTGAEILGQEFEVADPERGYGGKVDLEVELSGEVTTVDLKVRDDLRVFPDRLLQVAAYASAPLGHPAAQPTKAAVLTVGADGYSFDYVEDIPAAVEAFAGLIAYHKWLEANE
jgi:hypothetical protein